LGLQRPTAGRAEVFGQGCGPNAVGIRRLTGYLPTNPKLPGHLKPIEYLDLLGKLCRLPRNIRKPRISSLLRAVGLLGATSQRVSTFSTGMCTRLGIAASLVADPPLLIWDEPTAGLDPSARRFTLDLIKELSKTKTIVIATHILSDIDQICDHLGVMYEGKMVYAGSMQDLKKRLDADAFSLELVVLVPAILLITLADRPVADDSVTLYGVVVTLGVVGLVLTLIVSLGFLAGTVLAKPILAAVVLIFVWYPVNLLLSEFSLEELSPISLNQASTTLLRSDWQGNKDSASAAANSREAEAMARQLTGFLGMLSGSAAQQPQPGFFNSDKFDDVSLGRIVVSYSLPTLAALGLSVICFHRRDL
jgi:ABC-type Na+ transport system ATPase subunit NatA